MYEGDVGQVVLINNDCLALQSSNKLMFHLLVEDKLTHRSHWKCYKTIKVRGSIYYMKDTNRFQVSTA